MNVTFTRRVSDIERDVKAASKELAEMRQAIGGRVTMLDEVAVQNRATLARILEILEAGQMNDR